MLLTFLMVRGYLTFLRGSIFQTLTFFCDSRRFTLTFFSESRRFTLTFFGGSRHIAFNLLRRVGMLLIFFSQDQDGTVLTVFRRTNPQKYVSIKFTCCLKEPAENSGQGSFTRTNQLHTHDETGGFDPSYSEPCQDPRRDKTKSEVSQIQHFGWP